MRQKRIGEYWRVLLLVFFSAGVVLLRFVEGLWLAWVYALAGCIAAALLLIGIWLHRSRGHQFRLLLAAGICGFCWAGWTAAELLQNALPPNLEKKDVVITGVISGLVRDSGYGINFDFEIDSLNLAGAPQTYPERVRLSAYAPQFMPRAGETWQFTVRLKSPHGFQNPGAGFNYETWMFQQRIRASGYVRNNHAQRLANNNSLLARSERGIAKLRRRFAEMVRSRLGADSQRGIINALVVGARSDIAHSAWQLLQNTGTAHLVAISGLHIGLVAGLAGLLGSFLWRTMPALCQRLPAITVGIIVGVLAGVSYGLIAGLTLPTRRALSMLAVVAVAMLLKRRTNSLELLLLALAATLIVDPLAPLASSIWLSFGAVAILIIVAKSGPTSATQTSSRRWHKAGWHKVLGWLALWMRIQLWLLLGMLPIMLFVFQKISLISPLANLLAVPIVGMVVVPLALFALIMFCLDFEWLSNSAIAICDWLLELVWRYLSTLATVPGSLWEQSLPPLWNIIAVLVGVAVFIAGKHLPCRWLGIIWLVPGLTATAGAPNFGEFRLTMLDVGQGLSVVVSTHKHVMVFDTGAAFRGGLNLGQSVVAPYLRFIGARQIDRLVVSHGDNDHIGGALALSQAFTIKSTRTSVVGAKGIPAGAVSCDSNDKWFWDGVSFEVIWPDQGKPYSGNNSSCVILIKAQTGSVLLTGDIEREVEYELVKRHPGLLQSQVLVVPHHGSKTSSSLALLDAVNPQIGLLSAGYLSRYGHPHRDIVGRYKLRDIMLVSTADEGAVTLLFSNAGVKISGHRQNQPRYWQLPGNADFAELQRRLNQASP